MESESIVITRINGNAENARYIIVINKKQIAFNVSMPEVIAYLKSKTPVDVDATGENKK